MTLSMSQERTLAIVPKFSALLGMPSLLVLIHEVFISHKKGEGNAMLRALVGVSMFELLDAFGWFLSTWVVPEGSFAFATGTQASCSFQGFLLQVIIGAPLYNCALAYYFYLVVVKNKDAKYLESIEKYVNMGIITYAVFSSFLLLGLGQYNHVGAVCWVIGSPPDCGNSSFFAEGDVPCDRGDWAWVYGMVLFYIPLWICILLILYFNVHIYMGLVGTSEAKWFAKQSRLYCLAFCVTWAPSTTWSAMQWNGGGGFALDLAAAFFEPLAGFWNLLIFLRNRPSARTKLFNMFTCGLFAQKEEQEQQEHANTSSLKPTIKASSSRPSEQEQTPSVDYTS